MNNETPKWTFSDLHVMSGYKRADVADAAMKAIAMYTADEIHGDGELPAKLIGKVSVLPRRVGRTRIVAICYHNGKLLGSVRFDFKKS